MPKSTLNPSLQTLCPATFHLCLALGLSVAKWACFTNSSKKCLSRTSFLRWCNTCADACLTRSTHLCLQRHVGRDTSSGRRGTIASRTSQMSVPTQSSAGNSNVPLESPTELSARFFISHSWSVKWLPNTLSNISSSGKPSTSCPSSGSRDASPRSHPQSSGGNSIATLGGHVSRTITPSNRQGLIRAATPAAAVALAAAVAVAASVGKLPPLRRSHCHSNWVVLLRF